MAISSIIRPHEAAGPAALTLSGPQSHLGTNQSIFLSSLSPQNGTTVLTELRDAVSELQVNDARSCASSARRAFWWVVLVLLAGHWTLCNFRASRRFTMVALLVALVAVYPSVLDSKPGLLSIVIRTKYDK